MTCSSTDTHARARDSKSAAVRSLAEVDFSARARACARPRPPAESVALRATSAGFSLRPKRRLPAAPSPDEAAERARPLTLHSRALLHGRLRSNKGAITRCWRSGGNGARALSSQAVGEGKQALVRRRPWWSAPGAVLASYCRGGTAVLVWWALLGWIMLSCLQCKVSIRVVWCIILLHEFGVGGQN